MHGFGFFGGPAMLSVGCRPNVPAGIPFDHLQPTYVIGEDVRSSPAFHFEVIAGAVVVVVPDV